MALPYKPGDHGPEITSWQQWFGRAFRSYAPPADGYYGSDEVRAVIEMQRRLGLPQTGVFDEVTAGRAGYHAAPPPPAYRPIWIYSAPGSGAPWSVGPPFDLGEWCKNVLHLNHQPIGYPIGGYMGLMGGDPGLSYIDVINAEGAELERLLDANPDVRRAMAARRQDLAATVDVELWFTGYSQSADGMKEAINRLFGEGGKFALIRDRINGLVLFGDPTRRAGRTKVGNTPPGHGIANKTFPDWLEELCWCITNESPTPDFYACVTDTIRPLFYEWFIRAETELPFVIYTGQIIIPALLNLVAPFLGGGLGGLMAGPVLAGATGVPMDVLTPILGGVLNARDKPNPELIKLLSVQGVLTNLPQLIGLLGAVPGVAVHGDYYAPKPEFGGRSGIQVGCDIVAAFRR